MRERRFVPFNARQDYADNVSAHHMNQLQQVSETLQKQSFKTEDELFLLHVLNILEHRPTLNALWVDVFADKDLWDWSRARGVQYLENERAIGFSEGGHLSGHIRSKPYRSLGGVIKHLLLADNSNTPSGTSLSFTVSVDGVTFHPISSDGKVLELEHPGASLVIEVQFSRNRAALNAQLDGIAVGFHDSLLDLSKVDTDVGQIGLDPNGGLIMSHQDLLDITPDDHHNKIHYHNGQPGEPPKIDLGTDVVNILWWEHLPPGLRQTVGVLLPGETVLVRDEDDRICKVISPEGEDYLLFDDATDRLHRVINVGFEHVVVEDLSYDIEGQLEKLYREVYPLGDVDLESLGVILEEEEEGEGDED